MYVRLISDGKVKDESETEKQMITNKSTHQNLEERVHGSTTSSRPFENWSPHNSDAEYGNMMACPRAASVYDEWLNENDAN